jgi:putative addiction module component (TIGR02574 family)
MSKAEILAELPKLTPAELTEIQSRIEDLVAYGPDGWRTDCDLTDAEKKLLEQRIEDIEKHPEKGMPWSEVEARLKSRFGA